MRPQLEADRKQPLTQKVLTEFVEEAVLVLKEEVSGGYLTELEYRDYVRLFRFAADRDAEIADRDAQIASKDAEIQHLQELVKQLSSK